MNATVNSEGNTHYLLPSNFVEFLNRQFGERLRKDFSSEASYELREKHFLFLPTGRQKICLNKKLSPVHRDYFGRNIVRVANLQYEFGTFFQRDEDTGEKEKVFSESLYVKFLDSEKENVIVPQEFCIHHHSSHYMQIYSDPYFGFRQFDFSFSKGWTFNPDGFDSKSK